MSPYNYSFNNPVMFNDPSGADPGDGEKKGESIADPNRPKMPPINTSGRTDNARDIRGENGDKLLKTREAVAKNQAIAKQAEMVLNVKLDGRYIGSTKDGQYYNVSQREIKRAEYESNEAYGGSLNMHVWAKSEGLLI